jgi:chromosome partitioning protein
VARTIAVANQKGGVAKTTTVATLGAALAERGERVLLVDLDPQACLTFALGIDPEELPHSVTQVLGGDTTVADTVSTLGDNLDLLPSDISLAEVVLPTAAVVRDALRPVAGRYGWILLDAPPTLSELTVNALVAAKEVLIPLQCETLSHRGLGQLLDTIHDVRQSMNQRLKILGVLPTMYDARTSHAKAVKADVAERYELPVLEPPIPRSVRFAEAPAHGRTILDTARRSRGAQAYRELAAALSAT